MRFYAVFATLAVLLAASSTFAAPSPLRDVERYAGATSGKYLIKLKPGVSKRSWINRLKLNSAVDWDVVNGFASNLDQNALNALRASDDVETIAEDGIMHTTAAVSQDNAPWGLQRISQVDKLPRTATGELTYNYIYDESAGTGVDIYIVDTGVFVNHTDFGGRARWGGTFGVTGSTDGHGHGTHCAGTAAGGQYGVAKNASVIAVKVLSDGGSGSVSGIVSGLDWVKGQVAASGRPSIVSMSLGGSGNTVLDDAVFSLTSFGIHTIVAAGNSNDDALWYSPARSPSAITVGATTILDARASFSNYGALVDIYAPGQNVISSWIGSAAATNNISGTSMATPHVAGIVAYLIAKDGNLSPADMEAKVKALGVPGVLTGIPAGTINLAAQIGPLSASA